MDLFIVLPGLINPSFLTKSVICSLPHCSTIFPCVSVSSCWGTFRSIPSSKSSDDVLSCRETGGGLLAIDAARYSRYIRMVFRPPCDENT